MHIILKNLAKLNYNDLLAASPFDTGMINFGIGGNFRSVGAWGGWLENPHMDLSIQNRQRS